MQDALLGTNQRQHLALGIQIDIVPTLVKTGHSLAQLRCTLCGLIAMGTRLMSHLAQFVDGLLRGWHIGTANGQTDNILALGIHLCHLFQFATEVVLLY